MVPFMWPLLLVLLLGHHWQSSSFCVESSLVNYHQRSNDIKARN